MQDYVRYPECLRHSNLVAYPEQKHKLRYARAMRTIRRVGRDIQHNAFLLDKVMQLRLPLDRAMLRLSRSLPTEESSISREAAYKGCVSIRVPLCMWRDNKISCFRPVLVEHSCDRFNGIVGRTITWETPCQSGDEDYDERYGALAFITWVRCPHEYGRVRFGTWPFSSTFDNYDFRSAFAADAV